MRVLGEKVINEMVISDAISGMEMTLRYTTPTTKQRQQYYSWQYEREGDNVLEKATEVRLDMAKQILTDIGEDCFGLMSAKTGETKPISSDPESDNYRADWKELLCQYAPDLMELFVVTVFDGSRPLRKTRIPPLRGDEALDSKN